MRVIFHHEAGPALAARLAALEGVGVAICPPRDTAALAAALPEAEVLWHVLSPCTAALIEAAPRLRLIQKIGTGVNTIDLRAAAARGIAVCNLPGTNAPAVAEHALLLMLACLRRLPALDAGLRAGRWELPPATQDALGELGGRTVGLVGHGAVPRALAPLLRAFGCRLLYTATAPKPDALGAFRPLAALLAEADIVSLHLPLTPATATLIDAAALALMKPGAILINTARGGLVDAAALYAALASGRLGAAGLDVFAAEPAAGDPLLGLANVAATPHIAWLTRETFERSLALAAENCRRLAAGEELRFRVT